MQSMPRALVLLSLATLATCGTLTGERPAIAIEQEPPITWDTGAVRLWAAAISISLSESKIAIPPDASLHSDPGNPTYRTLEVKWPRGDYPQQMNLYFAADASHWWVSSIAIRVGERNPSYVGYDGPLFRTARGATFASSVLLESDQSGTEATLVLKNLRLTAFEPGTGPGPLTGCWHVTPGSGDVPTDRGEPLEDLIYYGLELDEVDAQLRHRGVCYTYRYGYPLATEEGLGYSERWCAPPPDGRVTGTAYLDDGEVVIFVTSTEPRERRPQPPQGWHCPSDADPPEPST